MLSSDFIPDGRLFQMMGPEYVKLCLNISIYGLGVKNECVDDDLSVGTFSLQSYTANFSNQSYRQLYS